MIEPGQRIGIPSGVAMSIPAGHYGRISPRSGLAFKNGIDVLAGTIDSDYTGEIGVVLINLGQESVRVNKGDRIAQIIIQRYTKVDLIVVDDLASTDRGGGGFGSTGR